MKIRTSLFFLSAFFVILIVALGFIVFQSFSHINEEIKANNSASKLIKDVFDLNIVTYEYFMHQEKRMQQQCILKYDSLGELLETMKQEDSHPECRSILDSITLEYIAFGYLFSRIHANFVNRKKLIEKSRPQVEIDITFALEERLIAQALMRTQKITSKAFKSSILKQQRIARVQQRTNLKILFSIIGFTILSSIFSFLISLAITRPLNELVKSAKVIGKGKLKHRVDIKTENEIGELASAFNEMAARRQQAEDTLRESEERYQLATKGGNVGVWDWNLATGDMFISPDLKAMLGYDDSEIKDHIAEWRKHIYAEDAEAVMKESNICIEGAKKDYHVEHRMVHKVGSIRWFLASGKVVRDESGEPIRFFGTNTDITKLKDLEGQLRQAQKMEAIAVLAGGIAHQFNNALFPITANIDMLELDFPDEQKIATCTKQMKGSANRMALLTDQLLAYARGGKYQARILSVRGFMRDTLPLIKHTIDPAIRIDTDIPRSIFNMEADITQMQMTLSAILFNASEAIEGEGSIRITCKNEVITDERAKDFPDLKLGPYVSLKIEDDGKGMDEETQTRIFEPFFTTKFQGRGLGMAAAYGIIKNHDGWISVDSELDKGTTVRIFLPASEAKVKELKKAKIEPAKGIGTILVIEDEEMVMDVNRALLEKLDYRVLGANTGNEAINIVKTFDGDIDLAILDIVLPDMDGKSIYPLLMEARPNLKVLVCSGYSINGPAQEILNAGAQDFIQKPFGMAEISEKLKKILESK